MTIVNQDNPTQSFTIIPKNYLEGNDLFLNIRDEETNVITQFEAYNIIFDFYDLVTFDCDIDILLEGRFYEVTIITNDGFQDIIVYKDRLFSTNQPINNYSVNTGEYTTLNTGNNDYIVL
jgi:hypothetical protein